RPARRLPTCRSGALDGVLEGLAGLETWGLAGGDLDLLARAGTDAGAGLAAADVERAEAGDAHAPTLGELSLDAVEDGVDGGAGLLLGEAGLAGDVVDQFRLVHNALRPEHMRQRGVLHGITVRGVARRPGQAARQALSGPRARPPRPRA